MCLVSSAQSVQVVQGYLSGEIEHLDKLSRCNSLFICTDSYESPKTLYL